ncbi:hypothetical protein GOBAR_AA20703 [Gossypium barbadense]|uniref:Uncharacterized protein n=1 Tax=Gossypium barbadense TaxID=3634 RepID=A0A2P5X9G0_GOSBA|nr:hypothetical protein GOBAR_AA20703 [Gossypium barbadense]
MEAQARVIVIVSTMGLGTGVSHARVILAVLPTAMLHGCVGKKFFCPVFTRLQRTTVLHLVVCARPTARPCAWPCGFENPVFSDSVSEFNVKY